MRVKTFEVTGTPMGKQRPRSGRGRMYTPSKTVSYENWVKLSYQMQVEDKEPLTGYIKANVVAYFEPPRSASRFTKQKMYEGEIRPDKRPDIDNITKIIFDSLNGLAYHDDAAIVYSTTIKKYVEGPDECARVEVTLVGD